MPAAQSFIQVLGTFLAKLIIFIASHFYYVKLASSTIKQLKRLVSLNLFLKIEIDLSKKRFQQEIKLRI